MTEQEARERIVKWAKQHFFIEEEHITPEVEIISIARNQDDEWESELAISTSADNPHVTFFHDEQHGLQIVAVEY